VSRTSWCGPSIVPFKTQQRIAGSPPHAMLVRRPCLFAGIPQAPLDNPRYESILSLTNLGERKCGAFNLASHPGTSTRRLPRNSTKTQFKAHVCACAACVPDAGPTLNHFDGGPLGATRRASGCGET